MPKVNYTTSKGLYQEAGSGINLSGGQSNLRAKQILVSASPKTLSARDSGSEVLLLVADNVATTINLPAGSTCQVGTSFKFTVANTNNNAYTIKRGTDDELIKGAYAITSTADDKTFYYKMNGTDMDTLTLTGGTANNKGGDEGTQVWFVWDGTAWQTWGTIISGDTTPTATAVGSDT